MPCTPERHICDPCSMDDGPAIVWMIRDPLGMPALLFGMKAEAEAALGRLEQSDGPGYVVEEWQVPGHE